MMVGEAQITGQAKEAHEIAHQSGLLGGILDQTFHEAFHLAKRIRTETELTRRPVSLVTLVERTLHEHLAPSNAPVLILGAGEMARQALRLVRTGDPERRVIVANRTPARALEMVADDAHAETMELEEAIENPPAVGTIMAVTSSQRGPPRPPTNRVRPRPARRRPGASRDRPRHAAKCRSERRGAGQGDRARNRRDARGRRDQPPTPPGGDGPVREAGGAPTRHPQTAPLRSRPLARRPQPPEELHGNGRPRASATLSSKELSHLGDSDRKAVERLARGMAKRMVQVPLKGLKGAAWHHSSAVIDGFMKGLEGQQRIRRGTGEMTPRTLAPRNPRFGPRAVAGPPRCADDRRTAGQRVQRSRSSRPGAIASRTWPSERWRARAFSPKSCRTLCSRGASTWWFTRSRTCPTEEPAGLEVAAIPERANPGRSPARSVRHRAPSVRRPSCPAPKAPSSVPRRCAAPPRPWRDSPGIEIRALRGNVPTRIRKLPRWRLRRHPAGCGRRLAVASGSRGSGRLELPYGDRCCRPRDRGPSLSRPVPATRRVRAFARSTTTQSHAASRPNGTLLALLGGGLSPAARVVWQPPKQRESASRPSSAPSTTRRQRRPSPASAAPPPIPQTAARVCFEALRLALPEVVSS